MRLRLTQQQVADAVGVSRGYIAAIEGMRANPSLEVVDRISGALGLEATLILRPPVVIGADRQRDLVHARCSGYVERRLQAAGWQTAREVELVHGRSHGWIDLLGFEAATQTLLVIEIKTVLVDLGSVERQLAWYGRSAGDVARSLGWQPRRIANWLLVLSSDEVEAVLRHNSDLLSRAFPSRAPEMLEGVVNARHLAGRGLALIDPSSKRRDWLIRSRIDGDGHARDIRTTPPLRAASHPETPWAVVGAGAWLLRCCEAHVRDRCFVIERQDSKFCTIWVPSMHGCLKAAPEERIGVAVRREALRSLPARPGSIPARRDPDSSGTPGRNRLNLAHLPHTKERPSPQGRALIVSGNEASAGRSPAARVSGFASGTS